MVLVDTSVWIDFFQSPESPAATTLTALIKGHNRVVLCGIVLQEILQGIRERKNFELSRERLLKFPYVETNRDTWLLAATLYRKLRTKGFTFPPVDATIAALTMQNGMELMSRDTHFETVALHSTLKLYQPY